MIHFFSRFKQLKEQEARKRQLREEEKRRAEVAANRKEDKSVVIETRNETDSLNGDSTSLSRNASTSESYLVVNGDSTSSEDERIQTGKISDNHNRGEDQHVSDKRNKVKLASFGSKLNFSICGQISLASKHQCYCDLPFAHF